ncbi:hypothetical protein D3C80_762570 [compost metagenome]
MPAIDSFFQWFQTSFSSFKSVFTEYAFGKLILFDEKKLGFLFVEIDSFSTSTNNLNDLITLVDNYRLNGIQTVCIWEDVWQLKQELVKGRINTLIGVSKRIHGRATKVRKITKPELESFLLENHLQNPTQAKFKYGLFHQEKLVAVCSFSAGTPMPKRGVNYKSYELIRFASLSGYTVVGGLSKLLKHFINEVKPSDIMTYADRDWSIGKSYEKLGFKFETITEPQFFWLSKGSWVRYYPNKIPEEIMAEKEADVTEEAYLLSNGFVKVYNTGNIKYRLLVDDGK